MQGGGRHSGFEEEVGGEGGYQRGLLGGFGQDGVASRQGRSDLAGEDGEGEVPRRDAGEDAARGRCQGGGAIGVVAQKIHRLAQFGDGVGQGLARLTRQKGEDLAVFRFVKVSGAAQNLSADAGRGGPRFSKAQGGFHIGGACGQDLPGQGGVGGVGDAKAQTAGDTAC